MSTREGGLLRGGKVGDGVYAIAPSLGVRVFWSSLWAKGSTPDLEFHNAATLSFFVGKEGCEL
jgi:hypothetical protein